jgi:hypothetical protein
LAQPVPPEEIRSMGTTATLSPRETKNLDIYGNPPLA